MMIKKKLLTVVLFVITFLSAFSQNKTKEGVCNVAKMTILNPGISYEKRISKFQTLFFQGFINTSVDYIISETLQEKLRFYFDPAITLQYRCYYNLRRRQDKKLKTELNNLNYVGAAFEVHRSKIPSRTYYGIEPEKRAIYKVGIVWGLQRNYSHRFSMDLNCGAGYLFSRDKYLDYFSNPIRINNESLITIMGHLAIGFRLNSK